MDVGGGRGNDGGGGVAEEREREKGVGTRWERGGGRGKLSSRCVVSVPTVSCRHFESVSMSVYLLQRVIRDKRKRCNRTNKATPADRDQFDPFSLAILG